MHQQRLHMLLSANRSSNSAQKSRVSGRTVSFILPPYGADCYTFQVKYVPHKTSKGPIFISWHYICSFSSLDQIKSMRDHKNPDQQIFTPGLQPMRYSGGALPRVSLVH